ncbi:MAG: O-antigen ligase family protein [Bacteroidia bacterium]|nr:O-antigen ligase family protein [Bacteroidia bacterium]
MLLRPLVDNFFWLKDISPFFSPLYIIGVLTPLLCITSMTHYKMPRKLSSGVDQIMGSYGMVVLINCTLILVYHFSLDFLGEAVKYITPTLLFLYARRFIQSKDDMVFILYTFLLSCTLPVAIFLYEMVFGPLRPTYLTEGRGGGARLRGEYSDIMSYAVYINGAMLAFGYLYLDRLFSPYWKGKKGVTGKQFGLVVILCLAALTQIKHVSSWSVFLAISVIFLFFNARNSRGILGVLFVLLILLPVIGPFIYEEEIQPLINKELNVVKGDADVDRAFNGRMYRWENYFAIWDDLPLYSHVIGVAVTGIRESPVMVSGGMHSDYVRNLFLGGFIGLALFLLFILIVLSRQSRFRIPERFLIISAIAVMVLYSISTLPTTYLSLMNFLFPIYAFSFLPRSRVYPKPARIPESRQELSAA